MNAQELLNPKNRAEQTFGRVGLLSFWVMQNDDVERMLLDIHENDASQTTRIHLRWPL